MSNFDLPEPAVLSAEQIESASRDLDNMLSKLADASSDEGERLNIVSILRALPEKDQARIPSLVRMIIQPPKVTLSATCEMFYPDGTPVEPDHAAL